MSEVMVCTDCGRRWTARGEAHCAGCHRHFSSDSAFDRHLKKPPEYGPRPFETCRDPATIRTRSGEPRLVLTGGRWGPLWSRPGSRPPAWQKPISAATAQSSPETGAAAALERPGPAGEQIAPQQGGG